MDNSFSKKEVDEKSDVYLKQVPYVNKNLDIKIEGNTVYIVLQHSAKVQKLLRKLGFKIPENTKIELDDYSSYVFLQIDGKKSIYEIGQNLKEAKKEQVEPLYERLVVYFNFLEKQKKWIYYK